MARGVTATSSVPDSSSAKLPPAAVTRTCTGLPPAALMVSATSVAVMSAGSAVHVVPSVLYSRANWSRKPSGSWLASMPSARPIRASPAASGMPS